MANSSGPTKTEIEAVFNRLRAQAPNKVIRNVKQITNFELFCGKIHVSEHKIRDNIVKM